MEATGTGRDMAKLELLGGVSNSLTMESYDCRIYNDYPILQEAQYQVMLSTTLPWKPHKDSVYWEVLLEEHRN